MEMILAENNVLDLVKKEVKVESLDEEGKKGFTRNDNKAKSLIIQYVEDSQLECLREKDTAYKMWSTLEKRFEKKGLPGQLYLKKKLLSMKSNEGDSLEKFIAEFEEVLRKLKATGAEIEEQDIICSILLSLPKSYETVVTVIENLPADTLKYESAKTKLFAESEKRNLHRKSGETCKGSNSIFIWKSMLQMWKKRSFYTGP